MTEISVENITKSYNGNTVPAIENISFEVKSGEIFGLIGPDGAGKTTLFRILATLQLPEQGNVHMMGLNILVDYKKVRKSIGYMPGRFSLYLDLTVEENLNFFATLYGTSIEENYDLIRDIYTQLEPFKSRRAGNLSGGMKQKLALCCALVHRPRILLLDEPTTGVDPVSRKEFWDILKTLKDRGITVLASTPYMDEATKCDRIALIQTGQILSIDTPQNIIDQYPSPLYAIRSEKIRELLKHLRKKDEVATCFSFGDEIHITFEGNDQNAKARLLKDLDQEVFPNTSITQITPVIEDSFINLMQASYEG